MNLDELEAKLAAALEAENRISLSGEDLGLPDLPSYLWPPTGALQLAQAKLHRVSEKELSISGKAVLPVVGEVTAKLFVIAQPESALRTEFTLANSISLGDFLAEILPTLDAMDAILEAIAIDAMEWDLAQGKSLDLKLRTSQSYRTNIAGLTLAIAILDSRLIFDSNMLDVLLTGKATLGDIEGPFTLQYANGRASASAQLPNLNLRTLASALSLPFPNIPGLDLMDDLLDKLEILFREDHPALVFSTGLADGELRCIVAHYEGDWCLLAGLHSPNPRFAAINEALEPLDVFSRIVAFGDPVVTYADRKLPAAPYPVPGGGWSVVSFDKGVRINGTLLFEGAGLEFLQSVFGIDSLPLAVPIGSDWSQVRLSAALPRPLRILGDLAVIENFAVSLSPDPQQVAATGEITITLFGAKLPRFTLGTNIAPGTASLFLLAEEAWEQPLGIPVTIETVGFQVSSAGAYGVLGKISLRDHKLEVATEFIGNAPTFLAGSLEGEMPLGDVLLDLVGIDLLPDVVQPTIKDFDLYVVLNPAGTSIATRIYPFGLSLRGTLSILGLGFTTDVHISKTQVRAMGALDGPIRLEPFFRLTGIDDPAPSFSIDTGGNPIAAMDGKIMLLGLEQSVRAVLGQEGFSASIERSLGAAHARLNVLLGEGSIAADGDVDCMITGKIGPIRLFRGGPDLGTIRIDTGARMEAHLRLAEDGPMEMTVAGRIVIVGLDIALPSFAVDVKSMEQLPAAVLEYIRDHAIELLADLLSDAEAWLKAIAEGLISAVEDVARTLAEHFEKTAEEVAHAMLDVLDETLEATAKGLQRLGKTAEEIGRIFKDLGREAEEIAGALKAIGAAPEVIGNVLRELGRGAEQVGRILEDVGFPPVVVDTALKVIFSGLPDVGWPPHVKHIKLPHVKHIKLPHVKHIKTPHVKHVKLPHVKHIKLF